MLAEASVVVTYYLRCLFRDGYLISYVSALLIMQSTLALLVHICILNILGLPFDADDSAYLGSAMRIRYLGGKQTH